MSSSSFGDHHVIKGQSLATGNSNSVSTIVSFRGSSLPGAPGAKASKGSELRPCTLRRPIPRAKKSPKLPSELSNLSLLESYPCIRSPLLPVTASFPCQTPITGPKPRGRNHSVQLRHDFWGRTPGKSRHLPNPFSSRLRHIPPGRKLSSPHARMKHKRTRPFTRPTPPFFFPCPRPAATHSSLYPESPRHGFPPRVTSSRLTPRPGK